MKFWSAAVIALMATAPACLAANARNPYGNIDPSNDAGNDTGDLQVEALNQAQIDGGPVPVIRHAQTYLRYVPRSDAYAQREATAPDAYAPPDGYYPARTYAPLPQAYPPEPSYQPTESYAPPGYAPYPQAGYGPPGDGPIPYASGYYAPRSYYAPPAYYPPPGYAPPPGY